VWTEEWFEKFFTAENGEIAEENKQKDKEHRIQKWRRKTTSGMKI
jgi:hypothetical protein